MLSLQTVVIASLVYLAYKYLPGIKLYSQLRKLPAFAAEGSEEQKQRYFQHGKEVYMEAYKKVCRSLRGFLYSTLHKSNQYVDER